MRYELDRCAPDMGYKLLAATVTPRPIAWVTTRSREGVVNAAPYSFFNAVGGTPPTVVLGLMASPRGEYKDTARNVLDTGEFVVNLVSEPLAPQMNETSIDAPPDVGELDLAGLDTAPSGLVAPPRIAACPVAFECVTLQAVETGPRQTVVIGRVLAVHVDDDCLIDAARGYVDTPKLRLIARMHGRGWYAKDPQLFEMVRPTWVARQAAAAREPGP
jgi:flavin reductase (DIM6/NTAB) family NADH-FMN oxidoreductase RutF